MKKTPIAQPFSAEDDLPSIGEDDLPGDPLDRPAPDTVYDGVEPPVAPHLQPSLVSVQHCHGPPRQLAIWLSTVSWFGSWFGCKDDVQWTTWC